MVYPQNPPSPGQPYRTPGQMPPPPAGNDGRSITSMVLGIVATVLCCLPLVGPICGTIAIVLFVRFNGDYHRSGQQLKGRGMAIAGLVTGIIGCAIGVFYTIYWLFIGTVLGGLAGVLGSAAGR
ncbi:MAG: hypothetical protein JRH20_12560 [Deltaproteobacteria bacterium]|nr:hypothetical protein [Deltaproteobacteria bacterium]